VRVEAGVAELGDFFGEQLDAVGGVAEDDRLVNLELERKWVNSKVEKERLSYLGEKGI
jgi:hypothetical protein